MGHHVLSPFDIGDAQVRYCNASRMRESFSGAGGLSVFAEGSLNRRPLDNPFFVSLSKTQRIDGHNESPWRAPDVDVTVRETQPIQSSRNPLA